MNKIILTGGGTTGHVTLNMMLIPLFQDKGWEIHYIGSHDGIEKELISSFENVTYYGIQTGKFRRYLTLENITDIPKVFMGIVNSYKYMKKIKPNVVFSKGGFVSVPVVIASRLASSPVFIHESDITIGLANKVSLIFSKKMYSVFDLNHHKAEKVGAILSDIDEGGTSLFDKDSSNIKLLIMGGSQGARNINKFVKDNFEELTEEYNILHIVGIGNEILKNKENYVCIDYCSEGIQKQIMSCDYVITRAGSNAIFEVLYAQKRSILVPLSATSSRGDQIKNAQYFYEKGYSEVIEDEKLSISTFQEKMKLLKRDEHKYLTNMKNQKEFMYSEEFFEKLNSDIKCIHQYKKDN